MWLVLTKERQFIEVLGRGALGPDCGDHSAGEERALPTSNVDLEPGFPEWTEIGQDSGLDPLGMQRPVEVLFQSLVPGISTITLRLRYYSFFAWVLEAFAKTEQDNDPRAFNAFHRRAEVLLALVSARDGNEVGVTGIDWASRRLSQAAEGDDQGKTIEFYVAADPDAPPEDRYLRNKGGAFGAIYSTQMYEMDLVELYDENIGLPYCTSAAVPLAKAFEEAVGSRSEEFLEVLDSGKASLFQLDNLSAFLPSRVEAGSAEQAALVDALLGRLGQPSIANVHRRETLKLVLARAEALGKRPRTDELKWEFFELADKPGGNLSDEVCEAWALYQASDLLRLAYECLLKASLVEVRGGAGGRLTIGATVPSLVEAVGVPGETTFKDFLATSGEDETIRELAEAMLSAQGAGETEEMVARAVRLAARLYRRAADFSPGVLEWLNVDEYFQSLVTEVQFYQTLLGLSAKEALGRIITERVVKRHLWVASRKLRYKAYTFLFEPDEGALRYRDDFKISPSSPRLDQAIQFLVDGGLVGESGITPRGKAELAKG